MATLTAKDLKGTWGTLLLPINHDESIDFQRLAAELDYLVTSGINGIYSNGTAGEFYNQTEDEFDQINELLARKCRAGNMPFQIGACHMSRILTLEKIKRSKYLLPDAYQIILPDWVTISPEEQINYLQKIAEVADPVPLVLYNSPHAKTSLGPIDFKT